MFNRIASTGTAAVFLLGNKFQAVILFWAGGLGIISHDQAGERLPGVSAPTMTESNTYTLH